MKSEAPHILLVEDEATHAALIRRAFRVRGGEAALTIAPSLRDAHAFLTANVPHLIIADLRLPDGAGVELLPDDRENAPYPVVIMTSHGDEQVAVEAIKAGALDYVVKTDMTLAQMPHIAERALREWGHIIERKRAEEAVRQAQTDLLAQQQHEKAHVERELKKAKDRLILQTRLATIGQMAAGIAHELRNPLGAVRNAVYVLKRRLPDDDPRWNTYLDIIEGEVVMANRLITNLLQMTRARPPSRAAVNLGVAVAEAFSRIDETDGIGLRHRFAPDPYFVYADPGQLQQVLVNLLTNAVQAMNGAGQIDVEAAPDDGFDRIVIQDSGPGIPPEFRERIFEPLFTQKAQGTGLGLAICRQLVEQHDGALDWIETPTPGAAFCIRFPRQHADGASAGAGHD